MPRSIARTPDSTYSSAANGLGREFVLRDVREESARVQENGVGAGRLHDGDAGLPQQSREILGLLDAVARMSSSVVISRQPTAIAAISRPARPPWSAALVDRQPGRARS